jgi:hypothetical protein
MLTWISGQSVYLACVMLLVQSMAPIGGGGGRIKGHRKFCFVFWFCLPNSPSLRALHSAESSSVYETNATQEGTIEPHDTNCP